MGKKTYGRNKDSPLLFKALATEIWRDTYHACRENFGIRDIPDELDKDGNITRRNPKPYTENRWLIERTKNKMMALVDTIVFEIETADSTYPHYMEELVQRRCCQDRAIGACFTLLKMHTLNLDELGVSARRYVNLVKKINREIGTIRAWRKSDNRFEKSLDSKESDM